MGIPHVFNTFMYFNISVTLNQGIILFSKPPVEKCGWTPNKINTFMYFNVYIILNRGIILFSMFHVEKCVHVIWSSIDNPTNSTIKSTFRFNFSSEAPRIHKFLLDIVEICFSRET